MFAKEERDPGWDVGCGSGLFPGAFVPLGILALGAYMRRVRRRTRIRGISRRRVFVCVGMRGRRAG